MSALKYMNANKLTSVVHMYKPRSIFRSTIKGPLTKMQYLLTLIYDEKYMCWTEKQGGFICCGLYLDPSNFTGCWISFTWFWSLTAHIKPTGPCYHYLRLLGLHQPLWLFFWLGLLTWNMKRRGNFTQACRKTYEKLFHNVIVTEQEISLMNVIEVVFHPQSTSNVYFM